MTTPRTFDPSDTQAWNKATLDHMMQLCPNLPWEHIQDLEDQDHDDYKEPSE
jgi:hypothetical protein